MSTAEIVDLGDGYSVTWPEAHIMVLVEFLQKQPQGLTGEVTIRNGKATCANTYV